jgi:hypothetical protein
MSLYPQKLTSLSAIAMSALCQKRTSALRLSRPRQQGVQMTEYPDTWHAFDYPLVPPTPTVVQNGQTTHCVLKEEPVGTIIHVATQKPFTYADDCVGRNPHMAHSANSTHATEEAVRELLKTVFQLN